MAQRLGSNAGGGRMAERFALLLDGFSALAVEARASGAPLVVRFRTVLEQFRQRREDADASEQLQSSNYRMQFHRLLNGYGAAVEQYRRQQEQVADDFNLLDVMRLTGNEVRHSMALAWLLDHNLRKLGTHAQGNLGFRLFLAECALPANYAECKYWVRREVVGDESIVDVEVACRGRFLIHIENKIWSCEGTDQTDREWSDLLHRAAGLNVGATDIHALFLTPHGTKPTNVNFRTITWGRIVRVLERFAEQAIPPDVRLFAAHYARALSRFVAVEKTGEDDNGETAPE